MAFRWRAGDGLTLNAGLVALWFFRGSRPVLLETPTLFVIFQGGGSRPPVPPLDPHVSRYLVQTVLTFLYCSVIFSSFCVVSSRLKEIKVALTLCMLDNFHDICHPLIFCKNKLFKKSSKEHYQSIKRFGSSASQPASQPDRQTDRQPSWQTDSHTDRQSYWQTDSHTDRQTDRQTDRYNAFQTLAQVKY